MLKEYVLENFYTEEEKDRIWREIQFLDSNDYGWVYPDKHINATTQNGEVLLQGAKQFYFSLLYGSYEDFSYPKSNIYTLGKKILSWIGTLCDKHDMYQSLYDVSHHNCVLNYYLEDKSKYKFHTDRSSFTMLSYFYKEPKNFTGGDLMVYDRKYEITNGFTIIIPSWMKHSSTPIHMIDKNKTQSGKYSIAHFFSVGASKNRHNLSDHCSYVTDNGKPQRYNFFKPEIKTINE